MKNLISSDSPVISHRVVEMWHIKVIKTIYYSTTANYLSVKKEYGEHMIEQTIEPFPEIQENDPSVTRNLFLSNKWVYVVKRWDKIVMCSVAPESIIHQGLAEEALRACTPNWA